MEEEVMKKLLILLTVFLMVFGLAACSKPEDKGFELALITDVGNIDDKSFNQGAWEGLVKYAEENDITHQYYKPTEQSTAAYVDAIELAVTGGAKVIVTPGFLFGPAVFEAQDLFPEVMFVLLDADPHSEDWTQFRAEDNVYSIYYAEEQSGFLAGYAAVKDGYTNLGFMGGMAVPAVVRFGYGFLQGAEYAAAEMGLADVMVKYHYTGNFDDTPDNKAKAASWYQSGVEVIFAAGGKVGNSVMSAAEEADKKVIGVDVDQSPESDTVITSAMKELGNSVFLALEAYYADEFPGGEIVTLRADVDGVGLPQDFSRFTTFKQADYDAVYKKLVEDTITLKTNADGGNEAGVPDAAKLGLTAVKITVE